jgi:hypothetical protein
MNLRMLALAALTAPALALAQSEPLPGKPPAKKAVEPKAAAKGAAKPAASGPVATVNGTAIPRSRLDMMMKQQASRGGQDNDQMRSMMRGS